MVSEKGVEPSEPGFLVQYVYQFHHPEILFAKTNNNRNAFLKRSGVEPEHKEVFMQI